MPDRAAGMVFLAPPAAPDQWLRVRPSEMPAACVLTAPALASVARRPGPRRAGGSTSFVSRWASGERHPGAVAERRGRRAALMPVIVIRFSLSRSNRSINADTAFCRLPTRIGPTFTTFILAGFHVSYLTAGGVVKEV